MKRLLQAGVATALLALAVPAAGRAAYAQAPLQFTTSMTELYGSAAPFTGKMVLRIYADGIVGGHYFPSDGDMFVPIVGGKSGDKIWFDIGTSGNVHFTGRLENDTIVGTAFDKGNKQYTFVANPASNPAR